MKIRNIIAAMTAMSVATVCGVMASAAYVPTATVNADKTVTVEIKAQDVAMPATQFAVAIPEGFKVTSYTTVSGGYFNQDSMRFAWAGTEAPVNDTVMLTLTLVADETVVDGTAIAVSLTPDAGFETEVSADKVTVDYTFDEETEDTEETEETEDAEDTEETEDVEGTDEETDEDTEEDVGIIDGDTEEVTDEDTGTSDEETKEETNAVDKGENPDTGVALAVTPAMLAGAVAFVTRKRK